MVGVTPPVVIHCTGATEFIDGRRIRVTFVEVRDRVVVDRPGHALVTPASSLASTVSTLNDAGS